MYVLESSQANIDTANSLDTTELGVTFMIVASLVFGSLNLKLNIKPSLLKLFLVTKNCFVSGT